MDREKYRILISKMLKQEWEFPYEQAEAITEDVLDVIDPPVIRTVQRKLPEDV